MAEIMTKMMFCMTVFTETKLIQPSWKSTDWSLIGWFLNHSTNSVVVGWSDGKTRQKGTNFKRLIDNKHKVHHNTNPNGCKNR